MQGHKYLQDLAAQIFPKIPSKYGMNKYLELVFVTNSVCVIGLKKSSWMDKGILGTFQRISSNKEYIVAKCQKYGRCMYLC